jgi:predicted ArsR family transcriptional regulator
MTRSAIHLNRSAVRVLTQLREGPRTVEDLTRSLRITSNAVRNQLRKLLDANLVTRSGTRPGASKPSVLYAITLEGQVQFSTIYLPVLTQFLRVAERRCSRAQLAPMMRETGKALASRYRKPAGDIRERAQAASRLLASFGGLPQVRQNGGIIIRSAGCPLAVLTSEHPAACNILEGLLAEFISAPVKSCCIRSDEPKCCFEVGGHVNGGTSRRVKQT